MNLPTSDDIFNAIVLRDFDQAKVMRQTLIERGKRIYDEYVAQLVIATNNTELVRLANIARVIKITSSLCDYAASISLEMLKTCLSFGSKCVHDQTKMYNPCGKCVWVSPDAAKHAMTHIDILDYLVEIDAPFNWGLCMRALDDDYLIAFQWLEKNRPTYMYWQYRRIPGHTFECHRYIHSKGHMPTARVYENALKACKGKTDMNSNNMLYVKWLQEIKCPGSFVVEDIPDQFEDKFKYDEIHEGDFVWLLKLGKEKRFPEYIASTSEHPLVRIFDKLIVYDPFWEDRDITQYIFDYVGQIGFRAYQCFKILCIMYNKYQRCDRMIQLVRYLNKDIISFMYRYIEDEDAISEYLDEEVDQKEFQEFRKYVLDNIRWGLVFLSDLNNWIECEGSYQAIEFVNIIEELWEKYEDRIPELRDPKNKEIWKELVEREAWKDEMHEFLYDLKIFN